MPAIGRVKDKKAGFTRGMNRFEVRRTIISLRKTVHADIVFLRKKKARADRARGR